MKTLLRKAYDELKYIGEVANQEDFASKLGYNRSYVSEVMNGQQPISDKLKTLLQQNFGINKDWLDSDGEKGMIIKTEKKENTEPQQQREQQGFSPFWKDGKILPPIFTVEEEVGMRLTAYTLASLLMANNQGAIQDARDYRVQQCWEDAKVLLKLMRPKEQSPLNKKL